MTSGGVDPILYSKYHDEQERSAIDFLLLSASILDWGNLTDQVVMDIGCGPGNTSSKWILSLFPDVQRIIGIDISQDMISLAKVLYPHKKIDYILADILEEHTLNCWEGTISKAISTFVFHWLTDQRHAFRNVLQLLKPGGEAAFLFEMSSTYDDCCEELVALPKWKAFLQNHHLSNPGFTQIPESNSKKFEESHYQRMLENLGFVVIHCKKEHKIFTVPTDVDDFKGIVMSYCSFVHLVPGELAEEFKDDLYETLRKRFEKGTNGRLFAKYCLITILARKPSESHLQDV